MKESFFRFSIRSCLKLLALLVFVGRGVQVVAREVLQASLKVIRYATPITLLVYFLARKIRAKMGRFFAPFKGHTLYLFGHRYFVHALVVAIVIIASSPALRAADTSGGAFGSQLPLRELVPADEEGLSIIDDIMPSSELESYLEGVFQNQQPPKSEDELPLALDSGALLKHELPGTQVLTTRTEIEEYAVQPGDTIWGIAEEFGLSVSTVLWENKLTLLSTIRPGQKLTILPISGVSHIVKKGETLGAIAKRYQASLDEIISLNKLADTGTSLSPGFTLVVPGGRPYVAPRPTAPQRRAVTIPSSIAATPGGKLLWPTISKRITQYFRWRHAGLDIGDKTGSPIYAAETGVVEFSGWGRGGWGNTAVVDHGGGLKTRYAHASKLLVATGEEVTKGQVIALVGSTGRSTGPHLHLTVYKNGRAVNPLEYLR